MADIISFKWSKWKNQTVSSNGTNTTSSLWYTWQNEQLESDNGETWNKRISKDTVQSNWFIIFKSVKVTKVKGRLRNWATFRDTKKIQEWKAAQDSELNSFAIKGKLLFRECFQNKSSILFLYSTTVKPHFYRNTSIYIFIKNSINTKLSNQHTFSVTQYYC